MNDRTSARRAGWFLAIALAGLTPALGGCAGHRALARGSEGAGRTTMSGSDRPLNSTIGTSPDDQKPGRMDGPPAPGVDLP